MVNSTTGRLVVALGLTAGLLGTAAIASAAGGSARSSGPEYRYGSANPFADASATVHVVGTGNGRTHVTLHIKDVDATAGRRFGAHVHTSACGTDPLAAGGHYQHAGAAGTLEQREVWLDFSVNAAGNGHAKASRPWSLDQTTPRSVVIHALPTDSLGAAGERLACIDLDGQA